ncbi:response regulator [Chryseobacterium sp. SN22]|uniref:response regulator n=1 Tax=Chryseobacterium sp. SN22 TaxID=2606431 RepID=UPI00162759A2|nr:response regulator [Chryseobacterium sp. SN22]
MENIKILICDDNHDNLDTVAFILEHEGYCVSKETDSTNLIKKITDKNPDILIVDIWMPKITGDEIIRMIRADSEFKELPIIAYSARYDIEKVAIEAGADDYVSKPFDISHLIGAINRVLKVVRF